jgi:hypothetical protein
MIYTRKYTGILTGMADTTKTGKRNLTLALDLPLHADLKAAAKAQGVSMNRYVEHLVQADLARQAVRALNAARAGSGRPGGLHQAATENGELRAA